MTDTDTIHPQRKPNTILLIKSQALVAHESHFAGGIHLFSCLAHTLAASGFQVYVFTTATKTLVMHHAIMNGLLGSLTVEPNKAGQPEQITWTSQQGLKYSVAVQTEGAAAESCSSSSSSSSRAAAAALIEAVASTAADLDNQCTVLLDVDTFQHAQLLSSGCCTACCSQVKGSQLLRQQQQQQQQWPFMYALAQHIKQPCSCSPPGHQQQQQDHKGCGQHHKQQPSLLMLVQNLHHLPFGPCGTAARTLLALTAWRQVDGMLCVSQFVAQYMMQHAFPLLDLHCSSSSSTGPGTCGSSGSSNSRSSRMRLFVVHPAALGAFGEGPFSDLGAAAAVRLWGTEHRSSASLQQQQQQQQQQQGRAQQDPEKAGPQLQHQCHEQHQELGKEQQWQQQPVVACLKLSPEKGADIFFALAAQHPHWQFLAVCADETMYTAAAAAGLANVQLVAPAADVDMVLGRVSVLVVPSVLHEAFGLVVLDAMLRGIPVIVADAGALPEAAAGAAAAVLPVPLVAFPASGAAAAAVTVQQQAQQWQEGAASADAQLNGQADAGLPCMDRTQQQQQQQRQTPCAACVVLPTQTSLEQASQQLQDHLHNGICCQLADDKLVCCCPLSAVRSWQADQRSWEGRTFPALQQQCVDAWAEALRRLLSSRDVYMECSRKARAAAEAVVVGSSGKLRQQLVAQLGQGVQDA